jgi:hypothetical protein
MPVRDEAVLAVILPHVLDGDRRLGEHLSRVLEVEPALPECPLSLRRVAGDAHRFM